MTTYAQQKKVERLTNKVKELYDLADGQRGQEREATLRQWLKANSELDAYLSKIC